MLGVLADCWWTMATDGTAGAGIGRRHEPHRKTGRCPDHSQESTGMIETKLQIKKMLEAKSPDVTLQADDILFIPVSAGKIAAARTFEAAMSMATAVSIYAVHP